MEPTPCRARANLGQYLQMPGGRDWGLMPATWRRLARETPGGGPTTSVAAPGDFPDGPDGLFGGGGGGGSGLGGDGGGGLVGVLGGDAAWVEVGLYKVNEVDPPIA